MPDDLDWLAHRYLLDEMSGEEVVAFEERLATDEGAAEALARGTMLLATVSEAFRERRTTDRRRAIEPAAPGTHRRSNRLAGFVAVAASFALVCLLGVSQMSRWRFDGRDPSGTAAELVSIWRESASEPPTESDPIAADDDAQPAADDVPDWLMAAVALDVPETDDEVLEN